MKTKEEILSLPVEDLGLSHGTVRWARKLAIKEFPEEFPPDFKGFVSVQDVLNAYAKREHGDRSAFSRRKLPAETNFLRRLTELGLTRFDFIYLSPETVTLKKQRSFTREEWLTMPVLLLGTMKPYTVEYFTHHGEGVTDIQVQHLFGEDHRVRFDYEKKFRASFAATRALLKKLGFTSKDGGIMLVGTVDGRAEELARKHGISVTMAKKFVRIAKLEGWRYSAE
jgi:hypothetical protein